MKFCENCGSQLEDDALFCDECGSRVEEYDTENDIQPESAEPVESVEPVESAVSAGSVEPVGSAGTAEQTSAGTKKSFSKVRFLILGLIILAAIGIILFVKKSSAPVSISQPEPDAFQPVVNEDLHHFFENILSGTIKEQTIEPGSNLDNVTVSVSTDTEYVTISGDINMIYEFRDGNWVYTNECSYCDNYIEKWNLKGFYEYSKDNGNSVTVTLYNIYDVSDNGFTYDCVYADLYKKGSGYQDGEDGFAKKYEGRKCEGNPETKSFSDSTFTRTVFHDSGNDKPEAVGDIQFDLFGMLAEPDVTDGNRFNRISVNPTDLQKYLETHYLHNCATPKDFFGQSGNSINTAEPYFSGDPGDTMEEDWDDIQTARYEYENMYAEYLFMESDQTMLDDALWNRLLEMHGSDSFPGGRSLAKMITNEIYARHGYIFKDEGLLYYFYGRSWYNGYTSDMNEIESKLNQIEKRNVLFLKNK